MGHALFTFCAFHISLLFTFCVSHSCVSHLCVSHLCVSHLCVSHLCVSHLCVSHLCVSHSDVSHSVTFHIPEVKYLYFRAYFDILMVFLCFFHNFVYFCEENIALN